MSDRRAQLEAVAVDHAVARAWERYRVRLLANDLAKLINQCRAGHALLLKIAPDGTEHRLVRHDGIAMRALWLPVSQRIATFLPMTSVPKDLQGRPPRPKRFRGRCGQRHKRSPRPQHGPEIGDE